MPLLPKIDALPQQGRHDFARHCNHGQQRQEQPNPTGFPPPIFSPPSPTLPATIANTIASTANTAHTAVTAAVNIHRTAAQLPLQYHGLPA